VSVEEDGSDAAASPPESESADTTSVRCATLTRPVLYPNIYVWFVFLSALDIMLTWVVLYIAGPEAEANLLANWVVKRWGLPGMAVYKFALVFGIVCLCEAVGRRKEGTGRRLAEWCVAITAIPVVLALVQLLVVAYLPDDVVSAWVTGTG